MSVGVVGIRLEAVMQAWALSSRGWYRDCHSRPTKSGVIGLVANALGRDFADPIGDLAALRFGVRVDRPGEPGTDFHTSGGGKHQVLPSETVYHGKRPPWLGAADGDPTDPGWFKYQTTKNMVVGRGWNMEAGTDSRADTYLTVDHYLAGASFLAALEGPLPLITTISAALDAPARALFLGRKAYGPSAPLRESLQENSIEELFASTLVTAPLHGGSSSGAVDVYVEPPAGQTGAVIHDQPVSFDGPIRRAARFEQHYTLTVNPVDDEVFDSAFAGGTDNGNT